MGRDGPKLAGLPKGGAYWGSGFIRRSYWLEALD
jgi:hypothetical protein